MWWSPFDPGPGLLCGEETADAREARERHNAKAGESTSAMQLEEKMEMLVIPTPAGDAQLITGKKAYVTHDALGRPWSELERQTAEAIAGATASAKAAAARAEAEGFPGSNNESTVEQRMSRQRQSSAAHELQTAQIAKALRRLSGEHLTEDGGSARSRGTSPPSQRGPRPKPSMMQRGRELYGPTPPQLRQDASRTSSSGFSATSTCCNCSAGVYHSEASSGSAPPARPPPTVRLRRRASHERYGPSQDLMAGSVGRVVSFSAATTSAASLSDDDDDSPGRIASPDGPFRPRRALPSPPAVPPLYPRPPMQATAMQAAVAWLDATTSAAPLSDDDSDSPGRRSSPDGPFQLRRFLPSPLAVSPLGARPPVQAAPVQATAASPLPADSSPCNPSNGPPPDLHLTCSEAVYLAYATSNNGQAAAAGLA